MTERSQARPPELPSDAWCDQLAALIAASPINLVSRGDRAQVRRVHIDECVAVAGRLALADEARWVDLGTGGGLPGLVLAAAFPRTSWTLIDARAKKLREVDRFVRALGLENVVTVHGRAEDLADDDAFRERFAGVITRAVASLDVTVALSRGLVEDGEIVAIRGPNAGAEAAALVRWVDDLGVTVETVEAINGTMRPTWLIRMRGRGPAPARFPRARRALLESARGGTR
ncbi:MAG TPA: RsmG family class I SAM-dependent methyltransferase [Euzebyales bacterium]|nr:RsmG family class I SAM-dependent methyltransferase [Euzebyales bacterium]